ncbi:hypothetical protein MNV49_006508 [Pseudohyphozyma bogoriensis]|nr:hypothetical protein MNV49_006508 [Pseudohyphozyma bogoriensis]
MDNLDEKADPVAAGASSTPASDDGSVLGYIKSSTAVAHPRVLSQAQVALMALASTVGTGYFVNMGSALTAAGPVYLVLGYAFWSFVTWCINECAQEMVVRLPLEASFVRFSSRWIGESFGVAVAWNVWLGLMSFFAYELTAFTTILNFWIDLNPAIFTTVLLAAYSAVHLWDSRFFGRLEIVTTSVKLLVAVGLLLFVLVTMCGGNPKHDAYGFRNFKTPNPVAAKGAEGLSNFWTVLLNASFAVAGPDAISLAAGDVRNPRRVLPMAYKSVMARLCLFFILGPIALGCLTSSVDPGLLAAQEQSSPGAARSPWVAGIKTLGIPVLPSIINAALLFTVFSCANMLIFNATKTLHALAEDGYAPTILRRTNRNGVPYVAFLCNLAVGCLAYLQCGTESATVFGWFTSLANAGQILIWIFMLSSYLAFYYACKAQGVDRNSFARKGFFMPYTAYFALAVNIILLITNGYSVFENGEWSVSDFIFSYFAVFWLLAWMIGWQIYRRPALFIRSKDADLWTGMDEIDAHEDAEAGAAATFSRKEKIMSYIM